MKSVKSTKDWLGNDRGIIWNDPDIAIAWPVQNPLVSDKDKKHPRLKSADINFKTK
ncbi:MAG: dTDP-4-dehydrorhamnose 3,5-epimerase family protein [Candidatus Brocadiia bacterium]